MIEIVNEPIATTNSIELHITSTGGELNEWQYNLYWGHPDRWKDCTIMQNPPNPSKIIISENVAMCTEYGISVRAKGSSGNYVTSAGFKYVKTKGHAELISVNNFVIGADDNVLRWRWNIFNPSYYYDVTIVNANGDPVIKVCEDKSAGEVGNNLEASAKLSEEKMNALYAAGVGEYEFWVATKDDKWREGHQGNVLEASGKKIQLILTTYTNKLKPEFTDFTITAPNEILKGYSEVIIDYRLQLDPATGKATNGARAKYGATITEFIVVIEGEDHHLEDVYCEGMVKFTPRISGNLGITITAKDSRGYDTTVTKAITVTDYNPIEITSARAYRFNGSNRIDLELKGMCSRCPSIKYNYALPSTGDWKFDGMGEAVVQECAFDSSTFTFSYSGEAFTSDTSEDIRVAFLISDGVTDATFQAYVYSSSIISITGEKDGENKPIGRIKMNGHGIMGYVGVGDASNAELDSGIYEITFNGNRGFLEVLASPNMKMQRVTVYHSDDSNRYDVWVRFYTNSRFTNWKQIY